VPGKLAGIYCQPNGMTSLAIYSGLFILRLYMTVYIVLSEIWGMTTPAVHGGQEKRGVSSGAGIPYQVRTGWPGRSRTEMSCPRQGGMSTEIST
jgi:hypothetical protein